MGSPGVEPRPGSAVSQEFTKAERIQQLNDIDKSVTRLLQSAGLAIKTLTAHNDSSSTANSGLASRRETFTGATDSYLESLHSVDVRLKRQILGLREASIIPTRNPPGPEQDGNADGKTEKEKKSNLDVGWLNSRSGKVERDMEAELWAKARRFLETTDLISNRKDETN